MEKIISEADLLNISRTVLSHSSIALATVNAEGLFTLANDACCHELCDPPTAANK